MSENEKIELGGQEAAQSSVKPVKTDKEKKSKADLKKSKPGIFQRISRWFREMKSELKKVQWPTVKQTRNNTLTVIVCVLLIGVFIWVFDALAGLVVRALLALADTIKGAGHV